METKLNIIIEELGFINEKVDILNEKVDILHKDCSKMSEHIDFVDSIYEKLKYPLNSIAKLYIK